MDGSNRMDQMLIGSQVDGSSHIVHVEEETGGTRLAIDASTCLLEAEADPSRLISASPGVFVCVFVCLCACAWACACARACA